jgi:alpha-L-fucosidase
MLLNISPMADGTIPRGQKTVLLGIGDWLRLFGESIYATRAWTVYGEGPTKAGGGAFTAPLTGTNKDWRFTRTRDSATLYAICLGWPGNNMQVTITSITPARFAVKGVYLFGNTPGSFARLIGMANAFCRRTVNSIPPTHRGNVSRLLFLMNSLFRSPYGLPDTCF